MSVVIACRNAETELGKQLEALAGERWERAWEVVVADNGSTDGTAAVAESFSDRLPALRLVDASGRPGQWFALAIGVRAARGEFLLFLDADDEVEPGYVAAMGASLETCEAVGARLDCDRLNPGWVGEVKQASQESGLGTPFGFLPVGAGCSLGVRRQAYDAVGGFAGGVGVAHDVDLCWRLQLAGFRLGFVPNAVVRYRYRNSIRGIYRQAVGYGEAGPLLYRRYRLAGMPRSSLSGVLRGWAGTVRLMVTASSRAKLGQAALALGVRVGRTSCSIRNRVLYL